MNHRISNWSFSVRCVRHRQRFRGRFKQTALVAVLSVLGLWAAPQNAGSQPPTTQEDTLRSIMSKPASDSQAIEDQLEELIESTKRARQERQAAAAQAETHNQPSDAIPDPASANHELSTDTDVQPSPTANSVRSMSEIRERIRILQKLRRDRRISQAVEMSTQLPGGVQTPKIAPPDGNVVPSELPETTAPPPAIVESTLSSIDQSLVPEVTQDTAVVDAAAVPSLPASKILPKPVNALALGESLFQTGNFATALNALNSVDTNTLSQSDRTWLDLLVALCQRRIGKYETAEGTLRDIANEESSDYPVQAAKWWLKHAKASHETLTKMNTLSAEFDSLLERSRSYVKR